MNKIEKLLRKISPKDRQRLFKLTEVLIAGDRAGLSIAKIIGSDFYRLKSGNFRIIFHYENSEVIIDAIKLRNESTYKNL
jgi:mRNA-degrading endonuclease RelE of RelBE toxin-antitoxin system